MGSKAAIEFAATVYKVQTLVDGGIRVTLDLSESEIATAAQLMLCKRDNVLLLASVRPSLTELDDATQKEAKDGAIGMGSRRIRNR